LTFCGQCGAALATPPPIAEERKVVTMPFCGLVGFTAMSEAADPEDIDARSAAITRYPAGRCARAGAQLRAS
jgi:class 3 adenylate cyclase